MFNIIKDPPDWRKHHANNIEKHDAIRRIYIGDVSMIILTY